MKDYQIVKDYEELHSLCYETFLHFSTNRKDLNGIELPCVFMVDFENRSYDILNLHDTEMEFLISSEYEFKDMLRLYKGYEGEKSIKRPSFMKIHPQSKTYDIVETNLEFVNFNSYSLIPKSTFYILGLGLSFLALSSIGIYIGLCFRQFF